MLNESNCDLQNEKVTEKVEGTTNSHNMPQTTHVHQVNHISGGICSVEQENCASKSDVVHITDMEENLMKRKIKLVTMRVMTGLSWA